jgi:hypothetical protein
MVTATRQHREEQLTQHNTQPRSYDNISLMPQISASISTPADFWSSTSGMGLPAELSIDTYAAEGEIAEPVNIPLNAKPVEVSQGNLSDNCLYQEDIDSELSYPSWYMESADDLDTMESNFGSLQQLFFHSILDSNGGYMPV